MNKYILILLLCCSSCAPVAGPDKSLAGAVLGAGWGAGAGAVIGNQTNQTGPGAMLGSAFGAGSGLLTGIGLDVNEGAELEQQRNLDVLRLQLDANEQNLFALQQELDGRDGIRRGVSFNTEIFFDADRASLRLGSAQTLERLANAVKLNPNIVTIAIHGHTDETGDTEKNQRLSAARAKTVQTFLISHGISSDRLRVQAHGASAPLASNATDVGRQLNRRVEIVLQN